MRASNRQNGTGLKAGHARTWLPYILALLVLLQPGTGFALQIHGHIEGLYVHQAAHLFFALSMAAFAIMVRGSKVINPKAARYLASGALLLAIWNLWAFSGHLAALFIPPEHFTGPKHAGHEHGGIIIEGWLDALYYILKMDHLICVPALVCFYLGLEHLVLNHTPRKDRADGQGKGPEA